MLRHSGCWSPLLLSQILNGLTPPPRMLLLVLSRLHVDGGLPAWKCPALARLRARAHAGGQGQCVCVGARRQAGACVQVCVLWCCCQVGCLCLVLNWGSPAALGFAAWFSMDRATTTHHPYGMLGDIHIQVQSWSWDQSLSKIKAIMMELWQTIKASMWLNDQSCISSVALNYK